MAEVMRRALRGLLVLVLELGEQGGPRCLNLGLLVREGLPPLKIVWR